MADFTIASLKSCEESQSMFQTLSIKVITTIPIELIQTYEKYNSLIGVNDLDYWPVDLDLFGFIFTFSTVSIGVLKQVD